MRPELDNFLKAALAAVEPGQAVLRALAVDDGLLLVGGQEYQFSDVRRVIVVGAGKASAPMAAGVEELLGNLLSVEGSVTVRYGHSAPTRHVRDSREAGHPVPDAAGVEAPRPAPSLLKPSQDSGARNLHLPGDRGLRSSVTACSPS